MDDLTATPTAADAERPAEPAVVTTVDAEIDDELLVEEISIDGMCGVY